MLLICSGSQADEFVARGTQVRRLRIFHWKIGLLTRMWHVPERDPFYAKIWQSYRRDTAVILAVIALVVVAQYLYLLYRYFVGGETLTGGAMTLAILLAGVVLLAAGGWFAVETVRAKDSRRMLWWTAGFVAAGTVLPIALLYFL